MIIYYIYDINDPHPQTQGLNAYKFMVGSIHVSMMPPWLTQ